METPFDEDTMMIMLEIPDMPGNKPRHIEKGPMEGMQESDSEELLRSIYCMLKKHFGEECNENDNEEKESENEF